jgi:acyl-CoA reductase-like NAD-dependent aldehyde dehydrogenase
VELGLQEGANPFLKGVIQETEGCYVAPTIFDNVQRSMAIAREEIFGPVLCVLDFATEEEAILLANDVPYGLAATVWTRSLGRGRRLAHAIRAGGITVRSSSDDGHESPFLLSHEPQKASGFGAEFGIKGLQSYSTLKAIEFVGR